MWTKYIYVCNTCDALIEVTACVSPEIDPACICQASSHVTLISWEDATVSPTIDTMEMLDEFKSQTGIAIDSLDVMKVTPREVVKINTNPYTL